MEGDDEKQKIKNYCEPGAGVVLLSAKFRRNFSVSMLNLGRGRFPDTDGLESVDDDEPKPDLDLDGGI